MTETLRARLVGLLAIVAAIVMTSTPSRSEAALADHRPEVLRLLNAIDQIPAKTDLLRVRVSREELRAVAEDATLRRYPRARAAGLLGHFDAPETRRWLRRLVRTSDDIEVRMQALVGLTHLERAASQPLLRELLHHPHPELRAAAGRGLARIKSKETAALVRDRLQVETVVWVRAALRRAAARAQPHTGSAP